MNSQWAQQWALLPDLLGHHILISGLALLGGVGLSLPVGLSIAHRPQLRGIVLMVAGVIQTIPGLALLAAMVTLLGAFGFAPALAALLLYSILPTLRNTVTGIVQVDAAIVQSALAAGMTSRQILWEVQFPLALPVIIAGIRTAAVWVIGVATLSTPVGQASLGNFIFSGLQTRNSVAVTVGCMAAASLAMTVDLLLSLLQKGIEKHHGRSQQLAWAGLVAVIAWGGLNALSSNSPSSNDATSLSQPTSSATKRDLSPANVAPSTTTAPRDFPPLIIGAKTFTEQYVLAALLDQTLTAAGYRTKKVESLGSSVIFDALTQGHIDLYVDYTGTLWANAMKRKTTANRWRVQTATAHWLAEQFSIRQLGGLGFENAYALALRAETAQRLGISTIAELAVHAPQWSIGGDYEFFQRPEWQRLKSSYALNFGEQKSFDSTFLYPALREKAVDVITAFSSDGRIAAFDLVLLADPRQAFPPYDAVLLLGSRIAGENGVVNALRPLIGRIPVTLMRQASLRVDAAQNAETPSQAARWLANAVSQ